MKILVTGSTGLIGSALVSSLNTQGHSVTRLVRPGSRFRNGGLRWDPETGQIDLPGLEGFDAVIHLAGDPIAQGRWTQAKKARIRDSRVKGTQLLSESLARLAQPPKVLLCASAIGYYGDRGDELLKEESTPGTGFLAEVAVEWEKAALPAREKGIQVVHLRFGVVLSPQGGALKMMLPPFKLGLGGPLGSGKQFMSWISIEDALGAFHRLLSTQTEGPVNVVSPYPVTNREFTKILGKVLKRPTLFPVPSFLLKLAFGEMAKEALLASARVEPAVLKSMGYRFKHPELEGALSALLP